MTSGERYYVIVNKHTNEMLEDWLFNTLKFDSEIKAMNYIENNITNIEDYEIESLR